MKTSASNLRAKWGKFMRSIKAGHEITITDRSEPVAKLVPFKASSGTKLERPDPQSVTFGEIVIEPLKGRRTDSLAMLLEDRKR